MFLAAGREGNSTAAIETNARTKRMRIIPASRDFVDRKLRHRE
jgi:hypothetical protein